VVNDQDSAIVDYRFASQNEIISSDPMYSAMVCFYNAMMSHAGLWRLGDYVDEVFRWVEPFSTLRGGVILPQSRFL
jgi:hypothetical protein